MLFINLFDTAITYTGIIYIALQKYLVVSCLFDNRHWWNCLNNKIPLSWDFYYLLLIPMEIPPPKIFINHHIYHSFTNKLGLLCLHMAYTS